MANKIFGIAFGIFLIFYGIGIIINLKKYTNLTLNDKWQRAVFGKKLFLFLARYIGAPLAIFFGILIILAACDLLA